LSNIYKELSKVFTKDSGQTVLIDSFKNKSGLEYQLIVKMREAGGPNKLDSGEIIVLSDPYNAATEIKSWEASNKADAKKKLAEAKTYFKVLKSKKMKDGEDFIDSY